MFRKTRLYILATTVLVIIGIGFAVLPVRGDSANQINPTDQQETIQALVQQRFTQTAAPADLQSTADALFSRYLTATAIAARPTITPSPTLVTPAGLARGWAHFHNEEYNAAKAAFGDVITAEPNWIEGYIARGLTYNELEDWDKAIADFTTVIDSGIEDGSIYAMRGLALLRKQSYTPAIADFTHALELEPHFAEALFQRGYTYMQIGRFEAAIADFSAAIEIRPDFDNAYSNLYTAYSSLQLYYQSLIYQTLGYALDAQNDEDYVYAFKSYRDAINYYDENSVYHDDIKGLDHVYYHRGQLQAQLGNDDDALSDLNQAIQINPQFAPAYVERGKLYERQEKHEQALADFNQAIVVNPEYAIAYWTRAVKIVRDTQATASDLWQWVSLSQVRNIPWKRYVIGQPFTLQMFEGWTYTIPFRGRAGQILNVKADTVEVGNANADPLIVLLDSSNQALIADDDGGGEYNAVITDYALPADGVYQLIVGQGSYDSIGPVTVTLGM